MAKGDPEDLAAQAAKRAEFRLHHVGTKLNEREVRELEELTILSLCLINQLVAAFFTLMTARCRLTHKRPKVRVRRCREICQFFVTNRT